MRRRMQIIFQDPYASLNPRMTVGSIIGEPLETHNLGSGKARQERVRELLRWSGSTRATRTAIRTSSPAGSASASASPARSRWSRSSSSATSRSARSTSRSRRRSSTCSIELREQFGLTYLFIAHDLSVVRHISDRVGGDVPRQDRRARPAGAALRRAGATHTRARCCRRCRSRIRRRSDAGSGSSSPATSRRRRTRRQAADSTPAAGSTSGSGGRRTAGLTIRSCGWSRRTTRRHATMRRRRSESDVGVARVPEEQARHGTPAAVTARVRRSQGRGRRTGGGGVAGGGGGDAAPRRSMNQRWRRPRPPPTSPRRAPDGNGDRGA